MKGKITLELDYELNEEETHVLLSHPDLNGDLILPFSSPRLMQIQLNELNINKPRTPLEDIIMDGQELMETAKQLSVLMPEFLASLKGKK